MEAIMNTTRWHGGVNIHALLLIATANMFPGVAFADLVGTIVGDATGSTYVSCLGIANPTNPEINQCSEYDKRSLDPLAATNASATALVTYYAYPTAPDVYVQVLAGNEGAPSSPLANGYAKAQVFYDVAIREERSPPHSVGSIPTKAFVSLFHEWDSLFYPPDLNNYGEARISLELDLGPAGIDTIGEWRTNWLLPTDEVLQVVTVDIFPELVYTVKSVAECVLTVELAVEGSARNGFCQAYSDPILVFDQAQFDAQMGEDTFLLADYYSIEVSPNAFVPVPASAWLFGSGLLGLVGIARRKKTA